MFSMRARTLSGLSSFLLRSFGLSGSRYPSAHWPSPRRRAGARLGVVGVDTRRSSGTSRALARAGTLGNMGVEPTHPGAGFDQYGGDGLRDPTAHRAGDTNE